ncbi:F-box/kelch-repeat protein At3g06240-like [Cornus florida]|uniref:F-box/kelch-repeat protein At3g06240-like n=1 Tax=Cornus florida TaxID=4283 RepID=UPI00289CEFDC|nr:F-box/kelch-repeat protein At3g06240-like [Cornus florida]
MKKVKRGPSPSPILPDDLVTIILSRLPAKSLVRFKRVCKSWRNLFNQPHFVKMHLSRLSKDRKLAFSCCSRTLQLRRELLVQSGDDLTAKHILPPFTEEPVSIFGSCNGLLLLQTHLSHTLYLVNITTRELNKLPFMYTPSMSYGFGYDASTDDYKVVAISSRVASLYTMKTNSWRRIQDFPSKAGVSNSQPCLLLNGILHWFCCHVWKMISFDLAEEKFRDIPLPHLQRIESCSNYVVCRGYAVGVLGGCLCINVTGVDDCRSGTKFWVMKEYGKRESWTKLGIIIPCSFDAKPLNFSNNDEHLFLVDHKRLLMYNKKENTYRYPGTFNIFGKWFGAETYLESIVSPVYHNVV